MTQCTGKNAAFGDSGTKSVTKNAAKPEEIRIGEEPNWNFGAP